MRARSVQPGCTVVTVQTADGPWHHDAAADVLGRAVRHGDVVSELADGSFACLLAGALRRERLSLLAWKLLDALGPWRPCIGICIGSSRRQTYQALAHNARTAMLIARSQQSGFAFFGGPSTD